MNSFSNLTLGYVDRYFSIHGYSNREWFEQFERECLIRSRYMADCRELRRAGLLPADFIPVYVPGERGF